MKDNTFATILSLLPFNLVETKPGLNPNEYYINKSENDKIGITIIPNTVHYLVNPDPLSDAKEVRHIKVPVPAIELAQSIINDYISSLLAVSPPDAVPGLIAVRGDYNDVKEASVTFIKEIMFMRNAQNNWFKNLVDIADDTWSKSKSPVGISDLQRHACRSLDYKREWLNPVPSEQLTKCPICKGTVNEGALKCVACGFIINKVEYDKVMAGAA